MPSIIVTSWAPTLDLICVFAQLPKAAAPPDLFIKATIVPSITKKNKIPTFHGSDTCLTMPFLKTASRNPEKLPWLIKSPPIRTPTNRDE